MKLRLFVAGLGVVVSNGYAEEALQMAAYSLQVADEVLVTATRSPVALKDSIASASVITRDDIEKSQARDLYQVLRSLAGLQIRRNGSRGSATNVTMRGAGASGTLVLVDGINIESATLGETNLESISLDQVDRIEVVRGPKSSLYGSSAMGGVIQIFTRANKKDGVTYTLGRGSNNTVDTSISANGSSDSSQLNVTASHVVSDGIDVQSRDDEVAGSAAYDDDGYHRTNLSLNLEQALTEQISANLLFSGSRSQADHDSFYASNAGNTPYLEQETRLYSAALKYEREHYSTKLQYGKLEDASDNYEGDGTADFDRFGTTREHGFWENTLTLSPGVQLNFGTDYTHEEIEAPTAYRQTRRDNFGGYLNTQLELGLLSLSAGVRHDDNEQFGSKMTGDFAVGLHVTEDVTVSASVGTAYKTPSFNDLYYPDVGCCVGNPDLQPEEVESYELGVDAYQEWGSTSLRVYRSDIENKIDWVFVTQYIPLQVDEADVKGLELQVGTELFDTMIAASATYEVVENAATGEDLERQPRQRIALDVDRAFGRTELGFSVYAQNKHYEGEGEGRITLPGYGDVALRAAHRINEQVTVRARIDNLFDNDYVEIYGYNTEGRFVMVFFDYTPR